MRATRLGRGLGLAAQRAAGWISPSPKPQVLCLVFSGLGNTVMFTPVLSELRRLLPGIRRVVVGSPANADILSSPELAEETFAMDTSKESLADLALRTGLARRTFEFGIVALVNSDFGINVLRRFGIVRRTTGTVWEQGPRPPYTHPTTFVRDRHDIQNNLDYLRALGLQPSDEVPRLFVTDEERREALSLLLPFQLTSRSFAVVHGGLTPHEVYKSLPVDLLIAVLRGIPRALGLRPVLLAGPDESFAAKHLQQACGEGLTVINPSGPRRMAALLAHAAVCFGGDTGPLHVAAAVETPVVCCFGPSSHQRACPVGSGRPVIALRPPCVCGPCAETHGTPCVLDKACLRRITPEEVVAAMRQAMSGAAPPRP